MEILYTNCAGLDVHKKTVKVCLLTQPSNGRTHKEFRTYFTTTEELLKLGDWLKEQGCTHVAEDRHRGVLETGVQPAGRQFYRAGSQCAAYQSCTWKEDGCQRGRCDPFSLNSEDERTAGKERTLTTDHST